MTKKTFKDEQELRDYKTITNRCKAAVYNTVGAAFLIATAACGLKAANEVGFETFTRDDGTKYDIILPEISSGGIYLLQWEQALVY